MFSVVALGYDVRNYAVYLEPFAPTMDDDTMAISTPTVHENLKAGSFSISIRKCHTCL